MNHRIKIGIEVQRILRKKKHGMEVVALELIREIQKIDNQNDYTLYCRSDVDTACVTETSNFRINVLDARYYFTWEQITLPFQVRKDCLDILHSTCNTSALFSKIPLILTLHDIIYLEKLDFKGTSYQNFGNIYRRLVVPRLVNKSKVIITVSEYEKEIILKKFPRLTSDKVKVIYNAVNKKFNTNYPVEELNKFSRTLNLPARFMLFLGNTAPKKNTLNVIKAYVSYLDELPSGIPLVILDLDKASVFDVLEKLGKTNLIGHFIFPGYIPSDQMPLLYNLCTLFLYPSLRESFGLPILEAMACGVPVITSNTSSMPEVAGDAAIFVDPYQPISIKEAIVKLLESDSLQLYFKEKGLQRASEFTWESSARRLIEIYQMLGTEVTRSKSTLL